MPHTIFPKNHKSPNNCQLLVSIVSSQGPHEDRDGYSSIPNCRTIMLQRFIKKKSMASFALDSSGRAGLYHNIWLTMYAFITIFILMVREETHSLEFLKKNKLRLHYTRLFPDPRFLLFVLQNIAGYKNDIKCGWISASSTKWGYLGHLQPL